VADYLDTPDVLLADDQHPALYHLTYSRSCSSSLPIRVVLRPFGFVWDRLPLPAAYIGTSRSSRSSWMERRGALAMTAAIALNRSSFRSRGGSEDFFVLLLFAGLASAHAQTVAPRSSLATSPLGREAHALILPAVRAVYSSRRNDPRNLTRGRPALPSDVAAGSSWLATFVPFPREQFRARSRTMSSATTRRRRVE